MKNPQQNHKKGGMMALASIAIGCGQEVYFFFISLFLLIIFMLFIYLFCFTLIVILMYCIITLI